MNTEIKVRSSDTTTLEFKISRDTCHFLQL